MNFIDSGKFLKPTNSFIRFLFVGVINTIFGLSIMFFLLNVTHLNYWTSTFIGNTVGAFISFLLNRRYTFQSNVSYQKGLPRFLAIILACYLLAYYFSERIIFWLSSLPGLPITLGENSAILLGSGIYTVSNYLGQKYLVFTKVETV